MKKLAIAVHCCVFALGAVACGENDSLETNTGDETSDETTDETTDDEDQSSESPDAATTPSLEDQAILDVKAYVASELENLNAAALAIQDAAPEPDEDGWSAEEDEEAVTAMREAWKDARSSYEQIEGAIAVLFPNYDASTDERYDGFVETDADDNLFDGEGVTGVHAIERILWAEAHPQNVVDFESALPNYVAASFPSNEDEARDFVEGLAQRLVDDTAAMVTEFEPLALDAPSAFRGVIGSLQEQTEKLALATTGEDESRYAQYTLGDMRANAKGGRKIFDAFVPWLESNGTEDKALAADIIAAFDGLETYYDDLEGDAIPAVPSTWDPEDPSEDDLATAYGKLYTYVGKAADAEQDDSLVNLMLQAADSLGIAEL